MTTFNTSKLADGRANARWLDLLQQRLELSGVPLVMPISQGHLLMGYASALAHLGIHIGYGEGEVPPDKALDAITQGMRLTQLMAERDEADG